MAEVEIMIDGHTVTVEYDPEFKNWADFYSDTFEKLRQAGKISLGMWRGMSDGRGCAHN